jgi:hypothetical protein
VTDSSTRARVILPNCLLFRSSSMPTAPPPAVYCGGFFWRVLLESGSPDVGLERRGRLDSSHSPRSPRHGRLLGGKPLLSSGAMGGSPKLPLALTVASLAASSSWMSNVKLKFHTGM